MVFNLRPFCEDDTKIFNESEEVIIVDPASIIKISNLLPQIEGGQFGCPEDGIIISIKKDDDIFNGLIFKVSNTWTRDSIDVKISSTYSEKVDIGHGYVMVIESIAVDNTNTVIGYISKGFTYSDGNFLTDEFSIITSCDESVDIDEDKEDCEDINEESDELNFDRGFGYSPKRSCYTEDEENYDLE